MAARNILGLVNDKDEGKENSCSRTNSLMNSNSNSPRRGWIHSDGQLLPSTGVCYGVRYVGCMEVLCSMRSLSFDMRTLVAKESIKRICESAGYRAFPRSKRAERKLNGILSDRPNMTHSDSDVNLKITTDFLRVIDMKTQLVIADHKMQDISFASGGDEETLDFVAYVAKDDVDGRACHVLECGGELAQEVITTIGQAFELRFREYLRQQPKLVQPRERNNDSFPRDTEEWSEETQYYNDPTQQREGPAPQVPARPSISQFSPGSTPKQPIAISSPNPNFSPNDVEKRPPLRNRRDNLGDSKVESPASPVNDSRSFSRSVGNMSRNELMERDKLDEVVSENAPSSPLPDIPPHPHGPVEDDTLYHEEWFHGPLTRSQAEQILKIDGDFLVRESTQIPGQYVLSGMHQGKVKHLLLVDPKGVVRTRDREFESVSHLIAFHRNNHLPIVSAESELLLLNPIVNAPTQDRSADR